MQWLESNIYDILAILCFYSIVISFIIYKHNKKELYFQSGAFLMRSKLIESLIDKLAYIAKNNVFMMLFTFVCVCIFPYIFQTIEYIFYSITFKILGVIKQPIVSIVIPGFTRVGYVKLPFLEGILSIFILAIIHEVSHGIIARRYNLRIRKAGFGLFIFIPFAYVDIDDKELKKIDIKDRIKIYFAGSAANIVFAIFLSFILSFTFYPFFNHAIKERYVKIVSVDKESPAYYFGLSEGEIIMEINDKKITSVRDLINMFKEFKPGDVINLKTDKGNYTIVLANRNGRSYLGINVREEFVLKYNPYINHLLLFLSSFFYWLIFLNFNIGIVNLFPIFITDGGKIVLELFEDLKKRKIGIFINSFGVVLLILAIFLSYVL